VVGVAAADPEAQLASRQAVVASAAPDAHRAHWIRAVEVTVGRQRIGG
jgi:hypothetical protein